ncbi:methyl-accepting chemotaxis protein [Halonatronum saccharophilum]|uniref:methyl-accepting chemotaxis protein n=1 Tax=Halonatronum saccharophilum TaxID=150060 RepID=UPI00316ADC95
MVLGGLSRMESGDFSVELSKPGANKKELKLLRTFNKTNNKVGELVKELSSLTNVLEIYSEDLHSYALKGDDLMGQSCKGVEEMLDSIGSISASTQEASALAQQSASCTEDGSVGLAEAIVQIEEISSSVDEVVSMMNDLADNSQKIQGIVKFINNIADQTNLLALNASIEAARAGEAGRGFSVVAEEIRGLADSTGTAVGDIKELIEQTQSNSEASLKSVLDVQKKAEGGKGVIKRASGAFAEIKEYIFTTSDNIQKTSDDSQELSVGSEVIRVNVNDMQGIASKIKVSAQKLNGMAKRVSEHICEFKI